MPVSFESFNFLLKYCTCGISEGMIVDWRWFSTHSSIVIQILPKTAKLSDSWLATVKYHILIDKIEKSQKTTAPVWKKRFSLKHHLSSTECPKSDFDFRYLFILSSNIHPFIENSNFVIRWLYKAIPPFSSCIFPHFSSSINPAVFIDLLQFQPT